MLKAHERRILLSFDRDMTPLWAMVRQVGIERDRIQKIHHLETMASWNLVRREGERYVPAGAV